MGPTELHVYDRNSYNIMVMWYQSYTTGKGGARVRASQMPTPWTGNTSRATGMYQSEERAKGKSHGGILFTTDCCLTILRLFSRLCAKSERKHDTLALCVTLTNSRCFMEQGKWLLYKGSSWPSRWGFTSSQPSWGSQLGLPTSRCFLIKQRKQTEGCLEHPAE